METLTAPQISNRTSLENLKGMIAVIHTATLEHLAETPLWLLEDMEIVAKSHNNQTALKIIQEEIERNLESQARAEKAERRADEAEQWAREVKAWRQEVEELYNSIKQRLTLQQRKQIGFID